MPEPANPFGIADARLPAFCGRRLSRDDWEVIREIIDTCGLSRWQLAMTICECLGWVRPNGNPKTRECFEWLGVVAELGVLAQQQSQLKTMAGIYRALGGSDRS